MKYIIFIIILFIYLPWFFLKRTLSSGDWPYLFRENIQSLEIFKQPFLWLDPYHRVTAKIGVILFSLSWETTEKIFWFFPFILISLISSFAFFNYLFKRLDLENNNNHSALISIGSLIFTTNTYVLMIVGGGQMGVAIAYALTPLVLWRFFLVLEEKTEELNFKKILVTSSITAFQIMFDPRIFLLTIFIISIYAIFTFVFSRGYSISLLKKIGVISFFSFLLNSFWIIPSILSKGEAYQDVLTTDRIGYFSFAKFQDTISLLHPNWPENLFGKVYFMRPEFILLPIIVFVSLFFIKKTQKIILLFLLILIMGSFLAKGTNPPFGEFYEWLINFPLFAAFRDPTKWYLFTIISYSVVIPFSLLNIGEWICKLLKLKAFKNIILLFVFSSFIVYWLFLIRPALGRELKGTFRTRDVPVEYLQLKNFLINDSDFSGVLWVPYRQRFGFYSENHPSIDAQNIFGTIGSPEFLSNLKKLNKKDYLIKQKIKYIIIPFDSEGEIFLDDRKYSLKKREELEKEIDSLSFVKKISIDKMNKISIYEVKF